MQDKRITPTVGRKVYFYADDKQLEPMDATIIKVWASSEMATPDSVVNLFVIDPSTGVGTLQTSVQVSAEPVPFPHYRWMPYQVNQATKESAASDKILGSTGEVILTDDAVESKVLELGLTAPRVTKDEIDAMMARVVYIEVQQPGGSTSTFVHAFLDGKFLLASGHSACVSPENFNPSIGLSIAKGKAEVEARNKLWELEGYALYKRLIDQAAAPKQCTDCKPGDGRCNGYCIGQADAPPEAKAEPVFNTEDPDAFQG